jgi:N-acetylneuraminate synthase
LNLLSELQTRFDCPVGLSDHSGSLVPGIAAVALGAKLLEFHITFHRGMFGPDVSSSLTMEQTAELVRSIRHLEHALAEPVDKDAVSVRSAGLRGLFNKSIVAAKNIPAGTVLSREHLAFKKPGDGLPAKEYGRLLGRTTQKDLAMDELVREEHLI